MAPQYDKKLSRQLFEMIEARDVSGVEGLLADNPGRINFKLEKGGCTPLTKVLFLVRYEDGNHTTLSEKDGKRMIKALVEAGADVNHKDRDGVFPLWMSRDHNDVMSLLLDLGGDPNMKRSEEKSLLGEAVFSCNRKACELLLNAGANPEERDAENMSAFDWAEQAGMSEEFERLVKKSEGRRENATFPAAAKKQPLPEEKNEPSATARNLALLDAILKKRKTGERAAAVVAVTESPAEEVKAPAENDGWILLAPDRVAHETIETALKLKITEIFNFATKQQTVVTLDLVHKVQSNSQRDFDQIGNREMLDNARAALARLGPDKKETAHGPDL